MVQQSRNDAVLIDDSILVHRWWTRSAQKHGIKLCCYQSLELFLSERKQYSFETPIYVDYNFADQIIKGDQAALMISTLGFKRIFLSTANPDNISKVPRCVEGLLEKSPPWT